MYYVLVYCIHRLLKLMYVACTRGEEELSLDAMT